MRFNMKNIFIISALIILFAGCSVTKNDKIHHLTILHTNDHHGAILPIDSKGGLAQRATYINSIKATTKNILILDAGDINIGGDNDAEFGTWFNADGEELHENGEVVVPEDDEDEPVEPTPGENGDENGDENN